MCIRDRHQHGAHGQGHPGQNMEHDRGIHLRVFQQAVFQHVQRTLKDLPVSYTHLDVYKRQDLSRAYDQINDLSDELEDLEADLYEEDEDGESEDAEDEDTDGDDDAKDDDIASEPFYEVACPCLLYTS